jgi:hypothetical protein
LLTQKRGGGIITQRQDTTAAATQWIAISTTTMNQKLGWQTHGLVDESQFQE